MGAKRLNSILNNIEYSNKRKDEYSILNKSSKRDRKGYSEKSAQSRAMYLADKFGNPGGMQFYLKCAWNLTDNYLDWLVDYSSKKSNPGKYFVAVASRQMAKNA